MTKKQRLELTWIGKDVRPQLEPRILLEDPERSYTAAHRVSEDDVFDNKAPGANRLGAEDRGSDGNRQGRKLHVVDDLRHRHHGSRPPPG